MYDRLIRSGLWNSTRFVDLHDDTHRLLYVFLVQRSDDFACQTAERRELLREVCQCTQIHTLDALEAALEALARVDLVRLYEVKTSTNPEEAPLACLYVPRFRSARSYSRRKAPASPWCRPEQEQYGRVRQAYGREAFGPHGPDGAPLRNKAQQKLDRARERVPDPAPPAAGYGAVPDPDFREVGEPRAQGEAWTEGEVASTLRQSERNVASTVRSLEFGDAPIVSQSDELPLDQPLSEEVASELTQSERNVASMLTEGVGLKEVKSGGAQRKPRTDDVRRGTRIAEDWTIPPEWIDWAIGNALDQGVHVHRSIVLQVAFRFHNYYLAKTGPDATSRNWLARWRGWWSKEDLGKLARTQPPEPEDSAIARAR